MKPLDPFELDLSGTTLIEASAGTGKTYTITTLFCRLIAQGFPVESILVVTFTEAAAAELKIRIRSRLSRTLEDLQKKTSHDDELTSFLASQKDVPSIRARISYALSCFDQAAVMTIHSFCFRILKENAFESRSLFDLALAPDRTAFLRQVGYDFFTSQVVNLDPLFLKFSASRQVTPENFIQTFKPVLTRPDLACIPEPSSFHSFFDDYRKTLADLQKLLSGQKDSLADFILNIKGIKKRSYTKKNVPLWLDKTLDEILQTGQNTIFNMTEKGDPVYKFTRMRLSDNIDGNPVPDHPLFDLCDRLLDYSRLFEDNLIRLKHQFFDFFSLELEKMKTQQGVFFFDDLVNDLAARLLEKDGNLLVQGVRQTFKACLIDEFQDTDPQQYRIFSILFDGLPFFMIGDPKQAIYGFRGGDIFAYLTASRQSGRRFTLMNNYRSAPLLVEGINHLFSGRQNPFGYEKIEFVKVSTPADARDRACTEQGRVAPLQFCFIKREGHSLDRSGYLSRNSADRLLPEAVAQDMARLLQSGLKLEHPENARLDPVTPADIAVLVRTNQQAEQIQQALSAKQIPSYLSRTGSVFDSVQAKELYDIMCAVYEPEHTGHIRAALCTSVFSFSLDEVRMLDTRPETAGHWQTFFHERLRLWKEKGFISMIMSLLHSDEAFLKQDAGLSQRGLTNFYHLIELISQAGQRHQLSAYHMLKWYARQMIPGVRDESADELRLETDKKAVAIVTVHKSKGLEYPVVYLPYLWEGTRGAPRENILFHDPDHNDRLTMDFGSGCLDASKSAFEKEEQAEQMRLLYVGLTRASAVCRIFWGGFKSVETSSLAFLVHPSGCKDDEIMLKDLEDLAAQSRSMRVDLHDDRRAFDFRQTVEQTPEKLTAKSITRNIRAAWRISSFSSIVHADAASEPSEKSPLHEPGPPEKEITLESFPKGAEAGDFFHAVFETLDFKSGSEHIREVVETTASGFSLTDPVQNQMACRSVEQVLSVPLRPEQPQFCLKNISLENRLNETAFTFPVNDFKPRNLVHALELSGQPLKASGYLNRLAKMDIRAFSGFLKGFIDLIVAHEDRYYIVDYKTNYLGRTYDCYDNFHMLSAMADHHYYLQYHIYLVALHRFLKIRLGSYDYSRHFGGVLYLFIRGMHPKFDSRYGVFYDRPPEELLRSLSGIFKN